MRTGNYYQTTPTLSRPSPLQIGATSHCSCHQLPAHGARCFALASLPSGQKERPGRHGHSAVVLSRESSWAELATSRVSAAGAGPPPWRARALSRLGEERRSISPASSIDTNDSAGQFRRPLAVSAERTMPASCNVRPADDPRVQRSADGVVHWGPRADGRARAVRHGQALGRGELDAEYAASLRRGRLGLADPGDAPPRRDFERNVSVLSLCSFALAGLLGWSR